MENRYVIIFYHPISKQVIYLANNVDINDICYSEDIYIPGTTNINTAKIYSDIEAAKKDIYTLRYHHREFLQVFIGVKPIKEELQLENKSNITKYSIKELE